MSPRSRRWFGGTGMTGFGERAWVRSSGRPADHLDGRPIIGICNSWSELTNCNAHFRDLAQHVREGILEAGGVPMEFPVISPGEVLSRPTAMLLRNLCSMDVEETLRANPIDGVVLLMGCDKTTPALMMGAASVNLPTIGVSGGPMLTASWRGKPFGVNDIWRMMDAARTGEIGQAEISDAEGCAARSTGHCNVMGTASTMAAMVETLGVGLPHNATIAAVDARRRLLARMAGRRIVEMAKTGLTLDKILTPAAFANAIRVNAAIGGSTNAVIHLTAIARRAGVPLTLDDWDRLGRDMPLLVELQPSGDHMMQDLDDAGGIPAVIRHLDAAGLIAADAMTVTGGTIGENVADARCHRPDVVRTAEHPFRHDVGIAVLKGNLCPDGAVIKPSAATPALLRHRGRAIVFDGHEALRARIDDPDLEVDASSVLVLRNCGLRGYPGMPELGNLPIPAKLLRQGVTDMVRLSDARMSGTAFGTVVLHVSPEAAVGGPLALVEEGDWIELDVAKRRLSLLVDEAELARRRAAWRAPEPKAKRGYAKLFVDHVNQPHEGGDFDFLVGSTPVDGADETASE